MVLLPVNQLGLLPALAVSRGPSTVSVPHLPTQQDDNLPSFDTLNQLARAMTAPITQGVSPHAQYAACFDWLSHLSRAPGRQLELSLLVFIFAARLFRLALHDSSDNREGVPFPPRDSDHRFADPAWWKFPYLFWQQAFLAQEAWWRSATREVRGMGNKNVVRVSFMADQFLDVISPSNVPWLNPVVIERTRAERCANFVRGMRNLMEDWVSAATQTRPEPNKAFRVGETLAATPGQVIFRND